MNNKKKSPLSPLLGTFCGASVTSKINNSNTKIICFYSKQSVILLHEIFNCLNATRKIGWKGDFNL